MKRKQYIVLAAVMMAACSGQYPGVPKSEVLAFQTGRTYGDLYTLAEAYAESLNASVEADTLHPGMYADYGVTLALMGHADEACRMLNAEAVAFPESKNMVRAIKKNLHLNLADESTGGGRPRANLSRLEEWRYSATDAKRAVQNMASIIDSTDSIRVSLQTPVDSIPTPIRLTANQKREMLFAAQHQQELRKKQVKDSVAAAKQAKLDARKKAKDEKKRAEKERKKNKKK